MLSLATTLCSQESSSLGLPEFPVDNLSPALHVLVRINISLSQSNRGDKNTKPRSSPPKCVVAEHLPHDVLSAAHPKALPLQEHPGQGGTRRCGERTRRTPPYLELSVRCVATHWGPLLTVTCVTSSVEIWAAGWSPSASAKLGGECVQSHGCWRPRGRHLAYCGQRHHIPGIPRGGLQTFKNTQYTRGGENVSTLRFSTFNTPTVNSWLGK